MMGWGGGKGWPENIPFLGIKVRLEPQIFSAFSRYHTRGHFNGDSSRRL